MVKTGKAAFAAGWVALALLPGAAGAFCGTYVGPAGSEPVNGESRVALVFQDGRVTLTLANDYQGDAAEFGLLIPVPASLSLDDVRVVDAGAVNDIDLYTAPRMVSYSCDDVQQGLVSNTSSRYVDGKPAAGCGGSPSGGHTETTTTTSTTTTVGLGDQRIRGVAVVDVGEAGEYELALVDPTDGAALGRWANGHGFEIDPRSRELLDHYVEGGVRFLAARVSLEALAGRTWLSPLQISYDATGPGLPLLLGTASAGLEQDVTVFAVNAFAQGWLGISNYQEVPVATECLYEGSLDDLGAWYGEEVGKAVQAPSTWVDAATVPATTTGATEVPRATWVVEYAWGQGACDPCSTLGALPDSLVQELGWDGVANDVFVTRLHLRYGAEQVDEDPVMYFSGSAWNSQIRFVEHAGYLEDIFPLCDGTWGVSGETCADAGYRSAHPARGPTRLEVLGLPIPRRPPAVVPAGIGLLGFGAVLLGALVGVRRPRS